MIKDETDAPQPKEARMINADPVPTSHVFPTLPRCHAFTGRQGTILETWVTDDRGNLSVIAGKTVPSATHYDSRLGRAIMDLPPDEVQTLSVLASLGTSLVTETAH